MRKPILLLAVLMISIVSCTDTTKPAKEVIDSFTDFQAFLGSMWQKSPDRETITPHGKVIEFVAEIRLPSTRLGEKQNSNPPSFIY